MNSQGWKIKQITNIESGQSNIVSDSFMDGDAGGLGIGGYGYSFTEGIIILWEK